VDNVQQHVQDLIEADAAEHGGGVLGAEFDTTVELQLQAGAEYKPDPNAVKDNFETKTAMTDEEMDKGTNAGSDQVP